MSITIKDIAELAGVSTTTVSRVLNDNGFVKKDTRKLINKVMKQYNYTPQESKRKRNQDQTKVNLLKNNNYAMVWSGGIEASMSMTAQGIMRGLSEAASIVGATINIEFLPESGDISEILGKKKIDGFFLNGGRFSSSSIEKVRKFPVIWLLQSGFHDFGDRVQPDHAYAGFLAYQYLHGKGCKKFCCISCQGYNSFFRYWKTREQAFQNAAHCDKTECDTIYLPHQDSVDLPIDEQRAIAKEAVAQIKALPKKPDGFFVANAFGLPIYAELIANGFRPYKDFEFVAGDKEVCNSYLSPEPVKIDIGTLEIGQTAIDAMAWRIQHPERPRITHMVEPSLIIPDLDN